MSRGHADLIARSCGNVAVSTTISEWFGRKPMQVTQEKQAQEFERLNRELDLVLNSVKARSSDFELDAI